MTKLHYNYIYSVNTTCTLFKTFKKSHSNMVLIAADIAYWPATPRMKSMRPARAERLDNPGPEHSETKTKTETRECETETETKKTVTRPRPKTTRPRPRPVQSSQLHVKVTQIGMFYYFYFTHEVNNEPEMDFAFKMISK